MPKIRKPELQSMSMRRQDSTPHRIFAVIAIGITFCFLLLD